jgi:hypothetical protein
MLGMKCLPRCCSSQHLLQRLHACGGTNAIGWFAHPACANAATPCCAWRTAHTVLPGKQQSLPKKQHLWPYPRPSDCLALALAPALFLSAPATCIQRRSHAEFASRLLLQGLRMLLGVACREALQRGLRLTPLWSLFSPHGPVFRVMVRVEKVAGRQDVAAMQRHCGFVLRGGEAGEASVAHWPDLAAAVQR